MDVDEEQIAPFMADINRHFEYVDKEDILKKIVSLEFGKFLKYYANAPEIVKPTAADRGKRGESRRDEGRSGRSRRQEGDRKRGPRKAERGYRRLFINLGKDDGFYPGEVMQLLNRNMNGHQEVGHIDLLGKFSYIEVPEGDAQKVMNALDGTKYRGRSVRCNDADDRGAAASSRRGGRKDRGDDSGKKKRRSKAADNNVQKESGRQDDWRQFFQKSDVKLKGEEPDFSEDGWARRKPRKK